MFRRTVATVINERASLNLASELLGHTDPKFWDKGLNMIAGFIDELENLEA